MTSLVTIADLWADCEYAGRLDPFIVDYVIDQMGEADYGAFLHWAYRADRWPVGGTAVMFRWGALDRFALALSWYRAALPWQFNGKLFRRNIDGRIGKRLMHDTHLTRELFPTARAAFEFLYSAWQRMATEEKRGLWEAC